TEPQALRPDPTRADGDILEVELGESTDREGELLGEEGDADLTQVDDADEEEMARRRKLVSRPAEPRQGPLSGLIHDGSSLDYPLLEDDYEAEQRRHGSNDEELAEE